ncbi:DUF3046 domain-containing protein [Aquipuribacter nitratireducens]|uniref:DUF3046 domain-containing protein n=1 Tax=Aquipuribacter nitratireducens TaxID=650104 RepID=A0ABW0GK00_9MICO
MRLSEFRTLTHEEFGRALADTLVSDLVLAPFDATAAQALERGEDPRRVWLALCDAMDVPPERRLGRDRRRRGSGVRGGAA